MTTQANNNTKMQKVGGIIYKSLITNKEYSLSDKTPDDRHNLGIVKQEIIDELRITGITTRLMPYLDLMMIPYWEWIYEWEEEATKINTVKEQVNDDVEQEYIKRFDEIDDTITELKHENNILYQYIDEQIQGVAKNENNGLRLEIKEYIDDAIQNETEQRVLQHEDIEHDHGITQLKVQAIEKNAVAKRRVPLEPYMHIIEGPGSCYPCQGVSRDSTGYST